MIQTSATLVESATGRVSMRVRPEQLPSTDREDRVVKAPGLLVLVEDGCRAQELAVPVSASLKVGDSHGDVGELGNFGTTAS